MTATQEDMLSAQDEIDLSNDRSVETITTTWSVTSAEVKHSESEKGEGTYEEIIVESGEFPYPITLRFFTSYTPANPNGTKYAKDGVTPLWVAQQRGKLRKLAQATLGSERWSRANVVGKSFTGTTREDRDGNATVTRFAPLA